MQGFHILKEQLKNEVDKIESFFFCNDNYLYYWVLGVNYV